MRKELGDADIFAMGVQGRIDMHPGILSFAAARIGGHRSFFSDPYGGEIEEDEVLASFMGQFYEGSAAAAP